MNMNASILSELTHLLGSKRCLDAPEDLTAYSFDLFSRGLPDLVVLPESTKEVSHILSVANRHGIAVTPRGAGTSLTGGPVPQKGGIVIAMTRMNTVLEISSVDRLVRAQAGVVTADLQSQVAAKGLFYPPNPTSADYCTIGGNIATNAGGASGVKYGVTADYILELTLVLGDGRILKTGNRCVKSVSGFDFKRAFCGSEGLLGIITEVTLKLIPMPAIPRTALAYFDTLEKAADTVAAMIESRLTPSTMELMDADFLSTVADVYGLEFPQGSKAALLVEFDDGPELWPSQEKRFKSACQRAMVLDFAETPKARERLWQARKGGTAALVRNAKFLQTLDFAVPVSNIVKGISGLQNISREHRLQMVLIAHAGDGNLHPMFIYDPDDPLQKSAFETAEKKMCAFILSISGTLSGEHGIGMEKAAYLGQELSTTEWSLGRELKQLLDPNAILNPGKCGF